MRTFSEILGIYKELCIGELHRHQRLLALLWRIRPKRLLTCKTITIVTEPQVLQKRLLTLVAAGFILRINRLRDNLCLFFKVAAGFSPRTKLKISTLRIIGIILCIATSTYSKDTNGQLFRVPVNANEDTGIKIISGTETTTKDKFIYSSGQAKATSFTDTQSSAPYILGNVVGNKIISCWIESAGNRVVVTFDFSKSIVKNTIKNVPETYDTRSYIMTGGIKTFVTFDEKGIKTDTHINIMGGDSKIDVKPIRSNEPLVVEVKDEYDNIYGNEIVVFEVVGTIVEVVVFNGSKTGMERGRVWYTMDGQHFVTTQIIGDYNIESFTFNLPTVGMTAGCSVVRVRMDQGVWYTYTPELLSLEAYYDLHKEYKAKVRSRSLLAVLIALIIISDSITVLTVPMRKKTKPTPTGETVRKCVKTYRDGMPKKYVYYTGKIRIAKEFLDEYGNTILIEGAIPDGVVMEYYRKHKDSEGGLECEVTFKNDMRNGLCRWYHENGHLESEQYFRDNMREGLCRWYYEDGTLEEEENYREDKLDGLCRYYYENGNLKAEKRYRNGVIIGIKEYDNNGQLTQEYDFENPNQDWKVTRICVISHWNGRPRIYYYYINEKKTAEEFLDKEGNITSFVGTIPDGIVREYNNPYTEEELECEVNFINRMRNGLTKWYYKDGAIESEQYLKDNMREGLCRWYYENGVLKEEENYHEDALFGLCRYYDEKGDMDREITYEKESPEELPEPKVIAKTPNPITGWINKFFSFVSQKIPNHKHLIIILLLILLLVVYVSYKVSTIEKQYRTETVIQRQH